jgi:hypothetical protein
MVFLVGYLTMLYQTTERLDGLMNDEVERIWNEAMLA